MIVKNEIHNCQIVEENVITTYRESPDNTDFGELNRVR